MGYDTHTKLCVIDVHIHVDIEMNSTHNERKSVVVRTFRNIC